MQVKLPPCVMRKLDATDGHVAATRGGIDVRLPGYRQMWCWLRRPSAISLGVLLIIGTVAGVFLTTSFGAFVAYSNTQSFCISCHEMREFAYAEYRKSPHFKTRSGVRPICSDCHVPRAYIPKLWRKVQATFKEVPNHFLGKIDTREEFEAHRLVMAESVWATMKSNNSRECRGCHDATAMNLDLQKPRARAQHADALNRGETCIDCHKGIAHHKPVSPEDKAEEEQDFNL